MRILPHRVLLFVATLAVSPSVHVDGQAMEPQCSPNDPICLEGGYSKDEGSLAMLQRRIWSELSQISNRSNAKNMTRGKLKENLDRLKMRTGRDTSRAVVSTRLPPAAQAIEDSLDNIQQIEQFISSAPSQWSAQSVWCFLMNLVCGWIFSKVNAPADDLMMEVCEAAADEAATLCEIFGLGPEDPFADACAIAVSIGIYEGCKKAAGMLDSFGQNECLYEVYCGPKPPVVTLAALKKKELPPPPPPPPPGPAKLGEICSLEAVPMPCLAGVCSLWDPSWGTLKCCASYTLAPGCFPTSNFGGTYGVTTMIGQGPMPNKSRCDQINQENSNYGQLVVWKEDAPYCSGLAGDACGGYDYSCNSSKGKKLLCGMKQPKNSDADDWGAPTTLYGICNLKRWPENSVMSLFYVAEKGEACYFGMHNGSMDPCTNFETMDGDTPCPRHVGRQSNCADGLTCASNGVPSDKYPNGEYFCTPDADTELGCFNGKTYPHGYNSWPTYTDYANPYKICQYFFKGKGPPVFPATTTTTTMNYWGPGTGGLMQKKGESVKSLRNHRRNDQQLVKCHVNLTTNDSIDIALFNSLNMPDVYSQGLLSTMEMNIARMSISGVCKVSVYPLPHFGGKSKTYANGEYTRVGTIRSAILFVDPDEGFMEPSAALKLTQQTGNAEIQTGNLMTNSGDKMSNLYTDGNDKATAPPCCDEQWVFATKPNGDLVGILKGPVTASGKTEVHILGASSNYDKYTLAVPTPQAYTFSQDWSFGLKSNGDLVMILMGPTTGSGKTEVHILDASSDYQSYTLHAATAMGLTSPAQWSFVVKYNGDVVGILKGRPTGSAKTEVHILKAETNYQTYALHAALPLGYSDGGNWAFAIKANNDLACIVKGPLTGTGKTEVHILNAATNYQEWALHAGTVLDYTLDDCWGFGMKENNDLIGILKGPTSGSGKTEIHMASAGSTYQGWAMQTGTALGISGCITTTTTTTTMDPAVEEMKKEEALAGTDQIFGTEAEAQVACNADVNCKGVWQGLGSTEWVLLIPGTQTWGNTKSVNFYPFTLGSAPGYEITTDNPSLLGVHQVEADSKPYGEEVRSVQDDKGTGSNSADYINGTDRPKKQDERHLASHVDRVNPETGRRMKMKYDALIADNVTAMNLDGIKELVRVTCDDHRGVMLLETDTHENAKSIMRTIDSMVDNTKAKAGESGLVLTGHAGWGCTNRNGATQSIMHRITKVEIGPTPTTIQLQSSKAKLEEVFESLNLSMIVPAMKQTTQDAEFITIEDKVQTVTKWGRRRSSPRRRRHCFSCFAKEEAAKRAAELRQKEEEAKQAAEAKAEAAEKAAKLRAEAAKRAAKKKAEEAKQKAEEAKAKAEAEAKSKAEEAKAKAEEAKAKAEAEAKSKAEEAKAKAKEEAERAKQDAENAVKDAERCAKEPEECIISMAKKAAETTKAVAKGVMSAAEGKVNTNKKIPIPGTNSLRWNVDASGEIIEPSISFGVPQSGPNMPEWMKQADQMQEEAKQKQAEDMKKIEAEKQAALAKADADKQKIEEKYQSDKAKAEAEAKDAINKAEAQSAQLKSLEELKARSYRFVDNAEALVSGAVKDACAKAESAFNTLLSRWRGQSKAVAAQTDDTMEPIAFYTNAKRAYVENNPNPDWSPKFSQALVKSFENAESAARKGLENMADSVYDAAKKDMDEELAPVLAVCKNAQEEYSKATQNATQSLADKSEPQSLLSETQDIASAPQCKDCQFYANADVHVEIKVDRYKLQILECVLQGTTLGQLTVQQQMGKDGQAEFINILKTLKLADINLMIGAFPFHLDISMLMQIGINTDIEGSQTGGVFSFNAFANGNISQGIKVDANGASHINTVNHDVGFEVQNVPEKGEVKLSAYLMPTIQLVMDGIVGPFRLGEKISLKTYIYGAEASETCPAGSNYIHSDLDLQTDLSSLVDVKLFGKNIYKKVWPTVILDQKTFPLHSGCYKLPEGSPSLLETPKIVQASKEPISTGTTFQAIFTPLAQCGAEYPTINMACTVHSELDPNKQDAQSQSATGAVPVEFGCTIHKMWEVPVALPEGVTEIATGSSDKVHPVEFLQMTYVFKGGVFEPKVPAAECALKGERFFLEPGVNATDVVSDEEAQADPCFIYVHTNTGNLPMNIPDMKFKASLDGDGMILTVMDDGSKVEECFKTPVTLTRGR